MLDDAGARATNTRCYRFGASVLDPGARELTVDGTLVELEPRTFDVLVHLVEHRHRTVTKEELLDAIWGDRFVSESALTSQIKHARSAIGDDGRSQSRIKTVHRVGYRFVAPVEVVGTELPTPEPRLAAAWNVPIARPLFGRDEDRRAVRERVAANRLVTLTGPAGVGKTSLALTLASEAAVTPERGVWRICELADTRDPQALANVVLTGLGEGQHADADPTESLLRILEPRAEVLVLDNCEHVVDAARALVASLLARCPGMRVLATSREPLGVDEESVYPVAPLRIDAAVECFSARARDAGAVVDPEDPALAELCARLDRIPLAIELAAARARLLRPTEMLDLLDDRFRLLRDIADPGEAGSLHAAIAASWDTLDAAEQGLLARLGVLVGSFTLEDARSIAMRGTDPLDAVDALEQLVRCSLVVVGPTAGARSTFRLLESVRDFALERLEDRADAQRAHVAHFSERAERLDTDCQTSRVDDAIEEMRAIWTNLRAAVGYAAGGGDVTSIRRIVVAAAQHADLFAIYEIGEWCELADLDQAVRDDPPDRDRVLGAEALAVWARTLAHQGRHERARPLAERAWDLHESHATVLSLTWCAYYAGELDLVVQLAPRLVELSRDPGGLDRAYAEGFEAIVAAVRQEPRISSTAVDPARADDGVLGALEVLTEGFRLCTADPEVAAALLEAVVEVSLRHDYRLLLGAAASTLTQVALPSRPPREAMETLRRTLTRYRDRSMWNLISADIVMAAKLLADAGCQELAARLVGARLASGYAAGLSEVLSLLLQEELAEQLGEHYGELVEQGRAWRPPEAATTAIEGLRSVLEGD